MDASIEVANANTDERRARDLHGAVVSRDPGYVRNLKLVCLNCAFVSGMVCLLMIALMCSHRIEHSKQDYRHTLEPVRCREKF